MDGGDDDDGQEGEEVMEKKAKRKIPTSLYRRKSTRMKSCTPNKKAAYYVLRTNE